MSLTKKSAFLWSLLGAVFLTINMTLFSSAILGVVGLVLFLTPLGFWLGSVQKQVEEGTAFFGFLLLLSITILITSATYYIYGITPLTSVIILVTLLSLFIYGSPNTKIKLFVVEKIKLKTNQIILLSGFLLTELVLILTLFVNKTTDLMPSPWAAVAPWFFILYAVATGLLFYISYKSQSLKTQICLGCLHIFTTFSVTALLYPLGHGFDAFVHRTTEVWILNNGFITPKQPYYIGQYSFVVWLAQITKLPLFYIDVYLVPILASLTILPATIFSLKRAWNISAKYSSLFVWLVPFIPFLSLNLTTPHNVVLLFSILLIFIMPAYLENKINILVPFFISLAALATHPLLGAPIFIFVLCAIILRKQQHNKKIITLSLLLTFIILSFLLPAMFTLNNLRAGAGIPTFSNPILGLKSFFALFVRPYWYAKNTPLVYELLYAWQLFIAPLVIFIGLAGLIKFLRTNPKPQYLVYPFSLAGFIVSAWLLRSWIVFPDVVSYEQGDFPLRMIKASILFLLPFAIYLLYLFFSWLEKQKRNKIFFAVLLCVGSILMMLSFYLSYPQRNIKARFPGLNVTASDFKAVEWIHNKHASYDYIVLSNQLTSAAALTNYSFAKYFNTPNGEIFYYSVPTGGLLYKQYGKMLYEGQKREYMTDAMDLVGVNTAYFVLDTYWANSDKIIEGAKKTADSWYTIDEGKVWIFIYTRN